MGSNGMDAVNGSFAGAKAGLHFGCSLSTLVSGEN